MIKNKFARVLPFLFLLLSVVTKAQTAGNTFDYEVTFYNLKFNANRMDDSKLPKDKDGKPIYDQFASFLNIVNYDYAKYKLPYPLKQRFDSAEFKVKDSKGNYLKVLDSELFLISKEKGMQDLKSTGGKLSKEAIDALNNSKPGDQIIFRTVEVFDSTLNRQLTIPNFLIVYEGDMK